MEITNETQSDESNEGEMFSDILRRPGAGVSGVRDGIQGFTNPSLFQKTEKHNFHSFRLGNDFNNQSYMEKDSINSAQHSPTGLIFKEDFEQDRMTKMLESIGESNKHCDPSLMHSDDGRPRS